jgi:predicted dienelactone hydrolase
MKRLALLASLLLFIGCGGDEAKPSSDMASGADMTDDMLTAPDASPDLDESPDAAPDLSEDDMVVEDMGPGQITLPPEPWDIRARGPYSIGYRADEITYDAAPEGQPRTIKVVVWYPSTQVHGNAIARYMKVLRRPGIWIDVPIVADGKMPVLVFSHGNNSIGEQNYFMAEHFASHGWLVIAPYHTNNTIYDNEGSINFKVAPYRPQDITATIDWLLERPADDFLHDRADADRIALSGHSFGGFTTLASAGATFAVDTIVEQCDAGTIEDTRYCTIFPTMDSIDLFRQGFVDPRLKVAIPQAPAGASVYREGLANLRIPTLMFTGGMDRSLPDATEGDPIWAGLPELGHSVRVDLPAGGHFTFSNMCDILPKTELTYDDGCGPEFLDTAIAYDIINTYSMAFARRYMFDDHSHDALLAGQESTWGDALIHSNK